MGLCSQQNRESTVDMTGGIDLGLTICSQATMYVVLLVTTGILFCGRTKEQRPTFVLIQVSLLWLSQLCFSFYNILLALEKTSVNKQTALENIVPTVGDLLFLIHDWLFTEQFVSAALFLPIILDSFGRNYHNDATTSESSDVRADPREKVARRKLWGLMTLAYSAIAAWTIASLVIGTLIVRMSLWTVQTLQTVIFAISLYHLRKLITKIGPSTEAYSDPRSSAAETNGFSSNVPLMRWNQYVYMATILPFLFTFLVAYFTSKDEKGEPTDSTQDCVDFIMIDTSHFTVQLSNIPRAIMSCYMNIQFSKTRWAANRQFLVVFGANQRTVSEAVIAKEQEARERVSIARKQKFYREYADRELARIVISLVREKSQSMHESAHASGNFIDRENMSDKQRSLTYSEIFPSETPDDDDRLAQVLLEESQRLNSVFGNAGMTNRSSSAAAYQQQINRTMSHTTGLKSTVTDTSSPLQAVTQVICFDKVENVERLQSFKDIQRPSLQASPQAEDQQNSGSSIHSSDE